MHETVRAGAYLHHLHWHSSDPERLAQFYCDAMDMDLHRTAGEFVCTGPGRRLIISAGEAKHLQSAAFACRDADALLQLRDHAKSQGLTTTDFGSAMLEPGAFAVTDPDGRTVAFGVSADRSNAQLVVNGRIRGPLQHLTLASEQLPSLREFYGEKLGFGVTDEVCAEDGTVNTVFMTSNHEHHTLACFRQNRTGVDHHSYEAAEWGVIKDWCDHLGQQHVPLMWGPGRHGPGNNLFIFITDPDGNWIEISAELEVIYDRPVKQWPHEERTLNLWGKGLLRV